MFCFRFGKGFSDSFGLIRSTVRYSLGVRNKMSKSKLYTDQSYKTANVTFNSQSFIINYRAQDLPMLYEVFFEEVYKIDDQLTEKLTIVDLGAHVGFTSLYYWTLYGSTQSYIGIEGSIKNYQLLQLNTAQIYNYTAIITIISGDGRKLRFYEGYAGFLNTIHNDKGDIRSSSTLQQLIDANVSTDISLLKMDIEGAEKEILIKHTPCLTKVNLMLIELHEGYSKEELDEGLTRYDLIKTDQQGTIYKYKKKNN